MGLTIDAGFISLEVLALLYALLAIGALITLGGRYHANAVTLRVFAYIILANCACRLVYFGIPDQVWGTSIIPEDTPAFTRPWWGNLMQSAFYLVANWATVASYMTILYMWQHAHSIVRGYTTEGPKRAISYFVAAFAVWSATVMLGYVVMPYQIVLIMQTVMNVVVNVGVAVCFIYYWWYLSRAMNDVVNQAKAASDVVASPLPDGSGMLVHLNSDDGETVARSKQKLHRFSAICALYTVCAFLKVSLLLVELVFATHPGMDFDKSSWWILVFVYYLLTEIVTGVLVLVFMMKVTPVRAPRSSTIPGLRSESPRSGLLAGLHTTPTRASTKSPSSRSGLRSGSTSGAPASYHILAPSLE